MIRLSFFGKKRTICSKKVAHLLEENELFLGGNNHLLEDDESPAQRKQIICLEEMIPLGETDLGITGLVIGAHQDCLVFFIFEISRSHVLLCLLTCVEFCLTAYTQQFAHELR